MLALPFTSCFSSQCTPEGLNSAALGPSIYFPSTVWFPPWGKRTLVCPTPVPACPAYPDPQDISVLGCASRGVGELPEDFRPPLWS